MSDITTSSNNIPPVLQSTSKSVRVQVELVITVIGFIFFVIGAKPEWFGLDKSPVVGFVQIAVFLVALAIICLGGYIGLNALWRGNEKSIPAELGLRLISTGYVIAVFSGMADIFGMGSHSLPAVPYFGHLQSLGVQIGEMVIAIGFILLIPFHRHSK